MTACSSSTNMSPKSADVPASPMAQTSEVSPTVRAVSKDELKALLRANHGKWLVLNFWATWCMPCVNELPLLARFYNELDAAQVVLLSVSVDDAESVEKKVIPLVKEKRLPFSVYVLSGLNPEDLTEILGKPISGTLPCTLIYDRQGRVREHWEEALTWERLAPWLRPAQE